ncbi:11900_t:CDS:2 [Ambispora gerdemannii]|uniref:11900_t:CDS:1 n=1 Tax=Ambispora gerdemannii TaxID=144530 RepID=A0A9N9CPK4_9GLOM|nr:11900_t:CDS:2 [Ambispora gerdemannii]
MTKNIGVIFKKIPNSGFPSKTEHMEIVHRDIDIQNYELFDGDILVKNLYMSVDPYMLGRMRDPSIPSYISAFNVGHVLEDTGISEVIKSKSDKFEVGDLIYAMIGWEHYTYIPASNIATTVLAPLPGARESMARIPLSYYVGILGIPGMTAYAGLKEIGKPKAGETIFISAAAGAVGSIVGQMAKLEGLRVVGSIVRNEKSSFSLMS